MHLCYLRGQPVSIYLQWIFHHFPFHTSCGKQQSGLFTTHESALPGKKLLLGLVNSMVALGVINSIFPYAACPCLGCTLHVPGATCKASALLFHPKGHCSLPMNQSRREIKGHKLPLKWGTQRCGYSAPEVTAEVLWLWQDVKVHSWLI